MVGLEIQTMQVGEYKLLVQLDMEELFSGKTLTTFGYLKPKGDILTKLKQQIDTDIETLYQVIAEQPGRGHTVCMTTSQTVRTEFICDPNHTILKYLEYLTLNCENM